MRKKWTAIIVCFLMLFQFVPAISAQAAGLDFAVSKGVLTKYTGAGGDVTIPDNLGITSIGVDAFGKNINLTSMIIPNGVASIGVHAFGECSKLTSVTIPDSVTSIGNYAFKECSKLTGVII